MKKKKYERLLIEACMQELEAIKFYVFLSRRIQDPFVKTLLTDIAAMEEKHLGELKNLMYKDLLALKFPEIEDIVKIKKVKKSEITNCLTPENAIKLAIKMEEEAEKKYKRLSKIADTPLHKNIYLQLSKMEAFHKNQFKQLLISIDEWK